MSRFSSKFSLLAGVSAVVLVTVVSSGTVAQALVSSGPLEGRYGLVFEGVFRNAYEKYSKISSSGLILRAEPTNNTVSFREYKDSLLLEGDLTLDDSGSRTFDVIFSGANRQVVFSAQNRKIKAANDGQGTIQVWNGRADGQVPQIVEFEVQLGESNTRLKQLTVGAATGAEAKGGHAVFAKGVHVDNIDVIAGNHADEKATAEFRSDVTGTSITLNDNGVGKATVTFNATSGDKSVGLTIDGAAAGEGHLSIYDDDNGATGDGPRTITFTQKIGRVDTDSSQDGCQDGRLSLIAVGHRDGDYVAHAGSAVFEQDVRATTLKISGGNRAAEDSNARIEKNLTANVILYDYDDAPGGVARPQPP